MKWWRRWQERICARITFEVFVNDPTTHYFNTAEEMAAFLKARRG